jgi:hypothetical protein
VSFSASQAICHVVATPLWGVIRLGDAPLTAHGAVAAAASVCDVIRSDFSMHHDGVRLLFDDLESEPLIETQQRFAGYEAQADR